jgi:hypothetical protein
MGIAVASRSVDDTTTYACKTCGGRFPAARMSKSARRGGVVVYGRCLTCNRVIKRRQEQERNATPRSTKTGTLVEAPAQCDPAPARLLGALLRDDRDVYGFGFSAVWAEDVEFVLARVGNPLERKQWREAFEATRSTWAAAWAGVDGPGSRLSADLADA